MKKILSLLVVYIVIFSLNLNADSYEEFEKEIISENTEHRFVKCQKGKSHHTARLTYEELCKYGKECPKLRKQKSGTLCREELLSECFNKKAWLTVNNFFGVSEDINVSRTSSHYKYVGGKKIYLHCAYYN